MRQTSLVLKLIPALVAATTLTTPLAAQAPTVQKIKPVFGTQKVSQDPDDPAIWINRSRPEDSLILGTNKISAAEGGALYVFDLNGQIRQVIQNLDRPNNVDIEYNLKLGNRRYDIAVVTERLQKRLRIFGIGTGTNGRWIDLAPKGIPVFAGEQGEASEPMGVALYQRPKDGAIFAIVGRKSGPTKGGYLWVYRLGDDHAGGVGAVLVGKFGVYSGKKEIEAIAVDDALGYVYYSDETVCIRKYPVDPDSPFFGQELATFGREGYKGDHEGIAIYARPDGTGYLVCTDQIPAKDGGTVYHVYKREGEKANRHDHTKLVAQINGGADETDGIEITSRPLGARFPAGLFVAMNSGPKNFLVFNAEDVVGKQPAPPAPPRRKRRYRRRYRTIRKTPVAPKATAPKTGTPPKPAPPRAGVSAPPAAAPGRTN